MTVCICGSRNGLELGTVAAFPKPGASDSQVQKAPLFVLTVVIKLLTTPDILFTSQPFCDIASTSGLFCSSIARLFLIVDHVSKGTRIWVYLRSIGNKNLTQTTLSELARRYDLSLENKLLNKISKERKSSFSKTYM